MSNTNDSIVALGEAELTWGEFLRFLGILSLMSTVSGLRGMTSGVSTGRSINEKITARIDSIPTCLNDGLTSS